MLSKPQHKHSIDFSRIRKHPFVSVFDSPGNKAVGLKTTLSFGVTHLNSLIYRKLKSFAQAVFLTARLLPNVSWETMPGHSERQRKAFRSEVSWVFTTVSLSSKVLEGFHSLSWQVAGGLQGVLMPLDADAVDLFEDAPSMRAAEACRRHCRQGRVTRAYV